jgi:hypothetical protein
MIVQKLKAKLPLKDITINLGDMSEKERQDYVGDMAQKPLIYFNGLHIQENDLKMVKIHSFNFLPTIEMNFTDKTGTLDDKSYPLDNSLVSFFVDSKSEVYKEVRLDFKVQKFDVLKRRGGSTTFTLTGVLNCDYLYLQDNVALKDMTSYQALEQIAKDSGLGYASNIDSTNDQMTWINPYMTGAQFIQSIAQRSYAKEDSFMWTYVDLYNNLNYVDVEKAIEGPVKEDGTIDQSYLTDKKEKAAKTIVLSNDDANKDSNTYFSNAQILNRSTEMSIQSGYRRRVHMYDISGNWEEKAGEFLIFDLDSINTPGSENELIILKSSPTGEEFFQKNVFHEYLGKLDKDNVHLDYLYSTSQNTHNINNLQKIALKIIMPKPNYSLARYQKVRVSFSNQGTGITAGHLNSRLSGEWVIIGIGLESGTRKAGKLEQVVTLVRRELSPDKGGE